MLTTNIDIEDRLLNGQLGTIIKIDFDHNSQTSSIIDVKFDDEKAGNNLINKSNNQFAKKERVVPIEPILARFKLRPGKPSSPEVQRIQFPITLAWACTVHKVQGLTLHKIVVSFNLERQKYFNYGQIYVAISRCKTLKGLYTLGQIEHKHVRTNCRVHEEYERMRNAGAVSIPRNEIGNQNKAILILTLLNIRSLNKHSIDIKFDSKITDSDFILLTETQLVPESNDQEIRNNLVQYTLYRQDHD